mmetsp:Transcript_47525/g.152269  ORF Transcript_47525/g.152269 Transcript_47525/m.152269 type:complete len:228 (-) Transcript_47525:9038-9721(-)
MPLAVVERSLPRADVGAGKLPVRVVVVVGGKVKVSPGVCFVAAVPKHHRAASAGGVLAPRDDPHIDCVGKCLDPARGREIRVEVERLALAMPSLAFPEVQRSALLEVQGVRDLRGGPRRVEHIEAAAVPGEIVRGVVEPPPSYQPLRHGQGAEGEIPLHLRHFLDVRCFHALPPQHELVDGPPHEARGHPWIVFAEESPLIHRLPQPLALARGRGLSVNKERHDTTG